MNMQPVESSNIRAVGYEEPSLVIEFHSGGRYSYAGVPPKVHEDLMKSNSLGRFFHGHIKDVYAHTKLN